MYEHLTNELVHYLQKQQNKLTNLMVNQKSNPADLVTNLDIQFENDIANIIKHYDKNAIILGEEIYNITTNVSSYWTIDPIDGTSNLVNGIPFFSTAISHVIDSKVEYAITYHHVLNQYYLYNRNLNLLVEIDSDGIIHEPYLNKKKKDKKVKNAVGSIGTQPYSKLSQELTMLMNYEILAKTADIRRLGCASIEILNVAFGKSDYYVEWGLKPWDISGGLAMVSHAGGFVHQSEIKAGGEPQVIVVAAINKEIFEEMVRIVNEYLY